MVQKETKVGGKILGVLIRVAVDFAVFWWIFLWNDGIVWERVSSITDGVPFGEWIAGLWGVIPTVLGLAWGWISVILKNFWHLLVFLSPYSREAALDPQFLYCLHWCSGTAALAAAVFLYSFIVETDLGILRSVLLGLLMAAAVWYAGFGVCFLLVKIAVWFHVLAALGAVLACALAAFLLFLIAVYKLNL